MESTSPRPSISPTSTAIPRAQDPNPKGLVVIMARTKTKRSETAAPKLATADAVMAALRIHYAPPAWALLEGVANGTGSRADRWADAVAMSIWPSRGLEIHGIEIKVSRSDLLRELKDPRKAEAVAAYCDRWWIAVGSAEIAHAADLPPAWGLLVPKAVKDGATMVVVKEAKQLEPKALDRGFLAAILRRAAERYDVGKIQQSVRNEISREVYAEIDARTQESHQREIDSMQARLDTLQKNLDEAKAQLTTAFSGDFNPRRIGDAMSLLSTLESWPNAEILIRDALRDLRHGAGHLEKLRETLDTVARLTAVLTGKQPLDAIDDPTCPRRPAVAG